LPRAESVVDNVGLRRRVRHHVNPLGGKFLDTQAVQVPRTSRPLEVELGCADARFLFERAPLHPERDFVGVEIRQPLVETVNELAAEQGIPNLRAVFANITTELDILFSDASLERVFVNFPDPWFKQRHAKRRLMTAELAEILSNKLVPGGELLFQSDIWTLGIEAMAVLEGEPTLANTQGAWSFLRDNPYDAKSLREVRVEEDGVRVWRLLYVRRDTGSPDPDSRVA
jgi:tRNA (guanine-N7-)-methyltransferase